MEGEEEARKAMEARTIKMRKEAAAKRAEFMKDEGKSTIRMFQTN